MEKRGWRILVKVSKTYIYFSVFSTIYQVICKQKKVEQKFIFGLFVLFLQEKRIVIKVMKEGPSHTKNQGCSSGIAWAFSSGSHSF